MQVAEMIKFDDFSGGGKGKRTAHCIACEEMLADALDQTLAEPDQAWFDRHIAGCVDCSGMVADAQRGAAWLELLKTPRPEPSAHLMDRILAQTSGQSTDSIPNFAPDFAPGQRVLCRPSIRAALFLMKSAWTGEVSVVFGCAALSAAMAWVQGAREVSKAVRFAWK